MFELNVSFTPTIAFDKWEHIRRFDPYKDFYISSSETLKFSEHLARRLWCVEVLGVENQDWICTRDFNYMSIFGFKDEAIFVEFNLRFI